MYSVFFWTFFMYRCFCQYPLGTKRVIFINHIIVVQLKFLKSFCLHKHLYTVFYILELNFFNNILSVFISLWWTHVPVQLLADVVSFKIKVQSNLLNSNQQTQKNPQKLKWKKKSNAANSNTNLLNYDSDFKYSLILKNFIQKS